jgi:hypothetical protein
MTVVVPASASAGLVLGLLFICCFSKPRKLCLLLVTHPNPGCGPLYMPEAMRKEYASQLGLVRVPGYLWGFWRSRPPVATPPVSAEAAPPGNPACKQPLPTLPPQLSSAKYADSAASAAAVAAAAVRAISAMERAGASARPWPFHTNPSFRFFYGASTPNPKGAPFLPIVPPGHAAATDAVGVRAVPARAHDAPKVAAPATSGVCFDPGAAAAAAAPRADPIRLTPQPAGQLAPVRPGSGCASAGPRSSSLALLPIDACTPSSDSPQTLRQSGSDMLPPPMLCAGPTDSDTEGSFWPNSGSEFNAFALLRSYVLGGSHSDRNLDHRGPAHDAPDSPHSAGARSIKSSWSESNRSNFSGATGTTATTCREALASLRMLASTMIGARQGADTDSSASALSAPAGPPPREGPRIARRDPPPGTPPGAGSTTTLADLHRLPGSRHPRFASYAAMDLHDCDSPCFPAGAPSEVMSIKSRAGSETSRASQSQRLSSHRQSHQLRERTRANVCAPGALAAAAQRAAALREAESGRVRGGGIGVPSLREGWSLAPLPEGMPPDFEAPAQTEEPQTTWFARLFK